MVFYPFGKFGKIKSDLLGNRSTINLEAKLSLKWVSQTSQEHAPLRTDTIIKIVILCPETLKVLLFFVENPK